MFVPYFSGETLDDVLRWVYKNILSNGSNIHPTKGPAKELTGVLLEIKNPLARISRTETKGKPFSCLGELFWYLAKAKDLSFISYYLPAYRKFADGCEIYGGYGPRLFDWNGQNQIANIAAILSRKPDSRQAVVQLFDAQDLVEVHKDIPCTCTFQFMIRHNQLHMLTYMRSNDAFVGMPHDVFCFTMLQEILARTLSVELGQYKHMVGSLHLYSGSILDVEQFLREGWQPTAPMMQPMPSGDPWPAIDCVLSAEQKIRTGEHFDSSSTLKGLNPYWADIVRMLLIFRSSRDRDPTKIRQLRNEMSSSIYDTFIERRLRGLQ